MPPKPKPVLIPQIVNSAMLMKHQKRPDEPVVVLKLGTVGTLAPYDMRGNSTRNYQFQWDNKHNGHVLKVPFNIWMQSNGELATDLMDNRHHHHTVIALIEWTPLELPTQAQAGATADTPPATPSSPEPMGAADTDSDRQNVVGLATVPTAAPASSEGPAVTEKPLHELAYDLVEPPKRIKALAALLGVQESELREAIEHAESRIELANAGWVRRKNSTEEPA